MLLERPADGQVSRYIPQINNIFANRDTSYSQHLAIWSEGQCIGIVNSQNLILDV